MRWVCVLALVVAASLALPAAADAAPAHGKRKISRHWHGYGFLPGYRTPAQLRRADRAREQRYWYSRNGYYWTPTYGYGGGGWYRGRWNGGSFGPCWKQTPIGAMWTCG